MTGPTATHVSVVNEDVTHGCLWEVRKDNNNGTYTLNGVLKAPCKEITVYVNLAGSGAAKFIVDQLVLAPIDTKRPLRLAFVIDPWIERDDPTWKADYIWWFGLMETALRGTGIEIESEYVLGSGTATKWEEFKPNEQARVSVIDAGALAALYPDIRSGLHAQRLRSGAPETHSPEWKSLVYLMVGAFQAKPDIVISMSDTQLFKDAFPEALHLYRDALYCREPFQDELTSLSPSGLYKNSDIAQWCSDFQPGETFGPEFLATFFPKSREIEDMLSRAGLLSRGFIILPLQDPRHYNFYDECDFPNQIALVEAVAAKFPDDKILITQHPDFRQLDDAEITVLKARFSHVLYMAEFEKLKNPTAQILPYCKAVAGVSTGLLVQSLILGKPAYLMGEHGLKSAIAANPGTDGLQAIAFKLLTRYFSSNQYLQNGEWLLGRLCAYQLLQQEELKFTDFSIDLPANVLQNLILGARHLVTLDDIVKAEKLKTIDKVTRFPGLTLKKTSHPSYPHPGHIEDQVKSFTRRVEIAKLLKKGAIGIELGVAEGVFSRQLLETNRFGHLFSVDMYEGDRGHDVVQYAKAIQLLSPYYHQNSLLRMRFADAIHLFHDEFFDFIYIDGYAHTGQDNGGTLKAWLPKVKRGGIFAGHDYHAKFPLVVAEVERFARERQQRVYFIDDDDQDNWNHGAASWFIIRQ